MTTSQTPDRRHVLAAYAVALATAVGSNAARSTVAAELVRVPTVETKTIANLERYCTASWRNAGIRRDEWEDCTQQALVELLESISPEGLPAAIHDADSQERRELNRAVWRLVQRCRRAPRPCQYDERFVPDTAESAKAVGWEEVITAANGLLSERQLRILELSRDGWRVTEISRLLGLSPERVSDEKYKAIVKLREQLA